MDVDVVAKFLDGAEDLIVTQNLNYRAYINASLACILSRLNPVRTLALCFC